MTDSNDKVAMVHILQQYYSAFCPVSDAMDVKSFLKKVVNLCACIINNKINGALKSVYLPISKLHSILTVANLLAHNNLWFCFYVQVNSGRGKIECSFEMGKQTAWRVAFILMLLAHINTHF